MNFRRIAASIALLALIATGASAVQRRSFVLFTGAATDTTATFCADSVGPYYTGDCERLYLYLKPSRPCRVAIQVRSHGDSLSGSGTPALTDTSKTFVWGWKNWNVAGTTDTLTHTETAINAVVTNAGASEYAVTFYDNGAAATGKWGGPRGVVIPLRGTDGEWYWGQNTSIRLRVLGPSPSGVVTWTASLQGWAP
jgi:hypothetical protein